MNREIDMFIGSTIGWNIKCDVQEDGLTWGKVLKIYIELDLRKPISMGRTLNLKGNKTWVPLTYKKLPRLCFYCGKIIHNMGFCEGEAITL